MILLVSTALAWSPLRVALDCQLQYRIDLCTFVRGTLDQLTVVAVVPKAEAQVVLHLNAKQEVSTDYVLLRAVSSKYSGVSGAPSSFEQQVAIDYRLPVDDQRAALDPPLLRVLAPFLSLAVPGSVTVALANAGRGRRSRKGFVALGICRLRRRVRQLGGHLPQPFRVDRRHGHAKDQRERPLRLGGLRA